MRLWVLRRSTLHPRVPQNAAIVDGQQKPTARNKQLGLNNFRREITEP